MQPIRTNRRTRFPKWIGTILILLATAMPFGGCSVPSSEKTDRFDPTASLEGRWQVTAIDGESLVGVPVEARGSSLVWEPECAGKVVDYRRAGDAIRFTPRPLRHNEGELPIVCSIGVPQAVVTLFDILPSLDRVTAQSQAKIALSNPDHIVRLERPGTDVIWPDGRWSLSSLDGRSLSDAQPTFQVRDGWINWMPVCAQQGRSFHIENDRIAIQPIRVASPPPPPGTTSQPPPVCPLPLHPELATAFSAMEAVTHIRIDPRGSVQLEGAGHHLIFNREPR